jgi:biotin carboxyl carrier protein
MEESRPARRIAVMTFQISIGGRVRQLEIALDGIPGRYHVTLDGTPIEIQVETPQPGVLSLMIEDEAFRCILDEGGTESAIQVAGQRFPYELDDPRSLKSRRSRHGDAEGPKPLKAPMPGRVVRVLVEPGARVEANQGVVVIEAMKMQNELKAPKAGKVAELRVSPGETVVAGQVLAVIE